MTIPAPDSITKGRKQKFLDAFKSKKVYDYGFDILRLDKDKFYRDGKNKLPPLSQDFEPNPYVFQYDMEVHLFINYNSIVKRQIELLETLIAESPQDSEQLNIKLEFIKLYGTGLTRQEHFWNAASVRWPTKTEADGKEKGMYVRNPWSEDFINQLCKYTYVNMFGGSGQGKTHLSLGFMAMMWDHYIDTELGGRCCFSTVAEDKMKGSTWPYMQRIYYRSKNDISLYCGRGIRLGEYTIVRPHDKKGGGSIKGILMPRRNDSSGVDKLTGSHGHPVGIYHIDELQSTPDAPVGASPNFLQNCASGWITASGNYDQDTDALGKNVIPVNGWDTVDENTHIYEGRNSLGILCGCIHYNNNLSPAFDGEGYTKWGHMLPTKKKKDKSYPSEISRRTNEYRRLWIGWRQKVSATETVLNKLTLRESGAMSLDANWDENYPVTHCFSFDSAPTSTDRNILVHFADGVDRNSGKWKLHFYEAVALKKVENAVEFNRKITQQIIDYARAWGVKSGYGIMDWTNVTGVVEKLNERGFEVKWTVYNQSPPDGEKRDKRNGEKLNPVLVDSVTGKWAHSEVTNQISMGALLMQNFVLHGQISGLHETFINEGNSSKDYDSEICLRKFIINPNKQYGELLSLEAKHSKNGHTGFTKVNGFSPDILDCLFQACNFAAMYRGMVPGYKDGSRSTYKHEYEGSQTHYIEEELKLLEEETLEPEAEFSYTEAKVDYYLENEDLIAYV